MARLAEEGAEEDHARDLEAVTDVEDRFHVRAPREVGLDAGEQDHVAVQVLHALRAEHVRRPFHGALAVLQSDLRSHLREVVEVLRVDLRDRVRAPATLDEADGTAGGLAGVVPAGEPGDQDRLPQVRLLCNPQCLEVRHVPPGIVGAGDPEHEVAPRSIARPA